MRTTSLRTVARLFGINWQNGSDKKRKTGKFLTSLLVLATLGMNTTVYAEGWRLITPARIASVASDPESNATVLWLTEKAEDGQPLNNTCGGTSRYIVIFRNDPRHDQVYTMIMTALLAERKLDVYILCDGTGGRFGQILLH